MTRAALIVLVALGCDGTYAQFLDAVPTRDRTGPAEVQVFVAIDGMSRVAFDAARTKGAFRDYHDADLITPFPGTSDYSWTRTLRGDPMNSYELGYYDRNENRVVGAGLKGVVDHALAEGIAQSLSCYRRFDFLGNGDLWMPRTYADPEGSLSATLDALFATVEARARTHGEVLVYLLNIDVLSHQTGPDAAVAALVEVDRRIRAFADQHPGRYRFTVFGDHGSTLRTAKLVDGDAILEEEGVSAVESLTSPDRLEALPLVHIRINYMTVHTHEAQIPEVARRASRNRAVDLAVAPLSPVDAQGAQRFGVFRKGTLLAYTREADGAIVVETPEAWQAIGLDLRGFPAAGAGAVRLTDAEAFAATVAGEHPDIFYRVATAFTHPAAKRPADVLLSFADDYASFGMHVPGFDSDTFVDGFHGSLSRASTLSVVATQMGSLPSAVRSDDLGTLLPGLGRRLGR